VADSYFASVQSALRLKEMGLRFIGTVKQAHKGYPMRYLSRVELPNGKGDHRALIHKDPDSGTDLLACCWVDRDRRFFISTCLSTTAGREISRQRWRQVDRTPNAEPEKIWINIAQPKVAQVYYDGCGKIDQHNRHRQDSLNIDKKLSTTIWHKRVTYSLLGMMAVDAYYLFCGIRGGQPIQGSKHFFEQLATQLVDNDFDRIALRKRRCEITQLERDMKAIGTDRLDPHKQMTAPTPTKKRKRLHPTHLLQGLCKVCKKPTTHVCRECQKYFPELDAKQFWICNKAGKECMGLHILQCHPNMASD
jgi:Transposase IS4